MNEGHIFIDEEITRDTLAMVRQQIAQNASADKLVLHIASPGGSVYAGYKIYHALKLSGKPIRTIIEGEAQSMATFIAMAGNEIDICNPSVYMIHMPSSEAIGTAEDMEAGASELRSIETEMIAAYSAKTKLPPDQIREMMRKTTVMTTDQAIQYGFADRKLGTYLQAVAMGQTIKKPMKKLTFKERIAKMMHTIGEVIEGPVAMDIPLSDGTMLVVDSEDSNIVGKPATINGQPANGSYPVEGGTIVCVNGIVTEAPAAAAPRQAPVPAPAPVQTPVQQTPAPPVVPATAAADEAAQLAAARTENEALRTQLANANQAAAAATQQATTTATALASVRNDLRTLTVGDDNAPDAGAQTPTKTPSAMGPTAFAQKKRAFAFLMEHMPWLMNHYPDAEIAKYADSMVGGGPKMVSILETNFNYTYPGILTTDIFYKPSLGNPALSDLVIIDQGIKSHKQYNLVNPISKILKPYTGCDRVFNNNRAFITNTTVRTKEFQVSESWCKDDFTNYLSGGYNFLAQEWLKTGNESFDPSGTPIEKIIDNVLSNALRLDVFRRFSFAAGNSSDDDYNSIDGFWDRLIDSSGASNYCVVRASATGGAGAIGFGTGSLAAGAALTALESAYANSNILLRDWDNIYAQFGGQVQKPTFWVTRSVWDNYYNSLIGTGAVTEQAFENLQKGLTTLTYKGYPVRPVSLWDQFLAESDNPLTGTTRHLIAFTTKDNHILGVENGSDLNKLEGWYERKDRKFYYEADLKMGYNYMHCDLQTIVY